MDGLQYASTMISELRTNKLTPKFYYELYMAIFDELRHLSQFLHEHYAEAETDIHPTPAAHSDSHLSTASEVLKNAGGGGGGGETVNALNVSSTDRHKLLELYEIVQYSSNLLPRLYLTITIGCVYTAQKNAAKTLVLMDLLEMCKGIQHPVRGLFLRYYLQQATRDQFPDWWYVTWLMAMD